MSFVSWVACVCSSTVCSFGMLLIVDGINPRKSEVHYILGIAVHWGPEAV